MKRPFIFYLIFLLPYLSQASTSSNKQQVIGVVMTVERSSGFWISSVSAVSGESDQFLVPFWYSETL